MFRPELFETKEKQEFFGDYCTGILELLDDIDSYIDSLERKIDSISDDREDGLLLYVNTFMEDMEDPVEDIVECFDRLLTGDITDGEIYCLSDAYKQLISYKTDIECCLKEYERRI